jgi:hypothetical protein
MEFVKNPKLFLQNQITQVIDESKIRVEKSLMVVMVLGVEQKPLTEGLINFPTGVLSVGIVIALLSSSLVFVYFNFDTIVQLFTPILVEADVVFDNIVTNDFVIDLEDLYFGNIPPENENIPPENENIPPENIHRALPPDLRNAIEAHPKSLHDGKTRRTRSFLNHLSFFDFYRFGIHFNIKMLNWLENINKNALDPDDYRTYNNLDIHTDFYINYNYNRLINLDTKYFRGPSEAIFSEIKDHLQVLRVHLPDKNHITMRNLSVEQQENYKKCLKLKDTYEKLVAVRSSDLNLKNYIIYTLSTNFQDYHQDSEINHNCNLLLIYQNLYILFPFDLRFMFGGMRCASELYDQGFKDIEYAIGNAIENGHSQNAVNELFRQHQTDCESFVKISKSMYFFLDRFEGD